MPVSFNSPPRNFFLLGSGGEDAVTNFFYNINKSTLTDGQYSVSDIAYTEVDQQFLLSGSGKDSNTKSFGWFEKRNYSSSGPSASNWSPGTIKFATPSVNTTLNFMKQTLSYGGDIIVGGKTGSVPWIAKYNSSGVEQWMSSSQSGDVQYTSVACKSSNYYACGYSDLAGQDEVAFIEKWDDNGSPLWGKAAARIGGDVVLTSIAANDRGEVVAVGEIDGNQSVGYVVKVDTNTGSILWDLSIDSGEVFSTGLRNPVKLNSVYIDGNDQIYIVGQELTTGGGSDGVIFKYTAEGNLIWHKKSPAGEEHIYSEIWSDTEVEQTIVLSHETVAGSPTKKGPTLIKYSKNGDVVFKRRIQSSTNYASPAMGLDGDPSFYYVLFVDEEENVGTGASKTYNFGKVSASGNGFGAFTYDATNSKTINYVVNSSADRIGRLSDGSVRNDSSDFISYPYSGNKILFDDYATNVAYKKTRHEDKDVFEYNGSPVIRPTDFQEVNLLGRNVSGRTWTDSSGKGNNGLTRLTEPFFGAGSVIFDGTGDSISVGALLPTSTGTAFTVDMFWYSIDNTSQTCLWEQHNGGSGRTAYFIDGSGNAYLVTEGNVVGSFAYSNSRWYFTRVTYTAGGAIEVFVDGVSRGTGTQTVGVDNANFVIGDRSGASESLNGYISNCRVVVGSALSGTEVPTYALKAITGTELLTCQGSTIADASVNNSAITVNGNAASTTNGPTHNNVASGYFTFDGTDDTVAVPDLTAEKMGNTFTAEAWIYPTNFTEPAVAGGATDAYPRRIMSTNRIIGSTKWCIGIDTSGRLGFGGQAGVEEAADKLYQLSLNTYYHVVLVHNGTSYKLYVNGEEKVDQPSSPIATTSQSYLEIGGRPDGQTDRVYQGRMGEVRVYLRAISPAEVFQNYNATKSKYINEAPVTTSKLAGGVVVDNSIQLNYDFGNQTTLNRATNLIPYSYMVENSWDEGSGGTLTINAGFAPDGSYTAAKALSSSNDIDLNPKLTWDGVGNGAVTIEPNGTYTFSVWLKASTPEQVGNSFKVRMKRVSGTLFNPENTITLTADWQRYSVSGTVNADNTQLMCYVGGFSGSEALVWGAQLEGGISLNSPVLEPYVQTYGTGITYKDGDDFITNKIYDMGGNEKVTGTPEQLIATYDVINTSNPPNEKGVYFDGKNSRIFIPVVTDGSGNLLQGATGFSGQAFTLEAWVYVFSFTSIDGDADQVIVGLGTTALNGQLSFKNGQLRGRGGTGVFNEWALDPATSSTQQWYHVVCTYGSQRYVNLYKNGSEVATYDKGAGLAPSISDNQTVAIGTYDNVDDSFAYAGWMGEVRIYNRTLTAAEVSQNFNATRGKYGV